MEIIAKTQDMWYTESIYYKTVRAFTGFTALMYIAHKNVIPFA